MWYQVRVIKDIRMVSGLHHISKGKIAYATKYNGQVLVITENLKLISQLSFKAAKSHLEYIKEGNRYMAVKTDLLPYWINIFHRRNS